MRSLSLVTTPETAPAMAAIVSSKGGSRTTGRRLSSASALGNPPPAPVGCGIDALCGPLLEGISPCIDILCDIQRSATTVNVALVAPGSVSDYNEQIKTNLQIRFALAAGVRAASTLSFPTPPCLVAPPRQSTPTSLPSHLPPFSPSQVPPSFVTVQVAAGSVIITALVTVPVGSTATGVTNALTTALGSTSAASSFLGITVTSAPTITSNVPPTSPSTNSDNSLALPLGLGLGLGLGGCLVLFVLFVLITRRNPKVKPDSKDHPKA